MQCWEKRTQLKIWREKFVRKKRRIRSFSSYFYVRNFVWKERKRAKNKQTLHGNWCVFCNNVLKFYTHTMNSLGEKEFCETNVKEGAKRTNDSLSFLFGKVFLVLDFSDQFFLSEKKTLCSWKKSSVFYMYFVKTFKLHFQCLHFWDGNVPEKSVFRIGEGRKNHVQSFVSVEQEKFRFKREQ
jgi:hypothetical protein